MSNSEIRVHFRVIKYIHESGLKLHLQSIPIATACTLYHQFFRHNVLKNYDPFLLGATCLSLACKIEEENVRIRDIVNVCYRTLHKNKAPLEIGDKFWALRESVASCELYLLRALQFKVVFDHPHKYLCHYLKALADWMQPCVWDESPVPRTSWALLRDSYHSSLCLDFKPEHIAIAVLHFSLLSHGLEVPFSNQAKNKWWQVFNQDITLQIIQNIISKIMDTYQVENQLPR
ncbi:cyclin-Q-like isoform X2 [Physella acuta]|uniref:cyclin-Q-like isoform X1 n=1 Tax=Physella acuta TaxID=109671 RepID=UPI0027DC43FD|nr:cyclin-Q-like isoform X1 [Physella acuta]XP_059153869.1 cyclin-Q-like isoform X2 [Physella acuta]